MTTYPEWRAMWDKSGPWRPTTDDIDTLLTEIDRHTPAANPMTDVHDYAGSPVWCKTHQSFTCPRIEPVDPPTSRWTVTDDGDIDNGEGWYLRMYRYTGMEVGDADRDDKEWVAAALNGGHPDPADTELTAKVEALRSVVRKMSHGMWEVAVWPWSPAEAAAIRAALMREGDDSRG